MVIEVVINDELITEHRIGIDVLTGTRDELIHELSAHSNMLLIKTKWKMSIPAQSEEFKLFSGKRVTINEKRNSLHQW